MPYKDAEVGRLHNREYQKRRRAEHPFVGPYPRRGGNRQTQPFTDDDLNKRFWARVDKSGECWVWTGFITPSGYGCVTRRGKSRRANRVAWEITNGPIPEGVEIRHVVCDNPPCVRPDHLALGTRQDNEDDKLAKGRQAKGEAVYGARLSTEAVRELRQRYPGESLLALANEFGVSTTSIHRAATGRTWGWLS